MLYDKVKYFFLKNLAKLAVLAHKAFDALKTKLKSYAGKDAIYQPAGAAGEYAKYACNFFLGCYGMCKYCYNKQGPRAGLLGKSVITLKTCFKSEEHAVEVFFKELFGGNGGTVRPELLKHGIFFTFTTDPCLPETFPLHAAVAAEAVKLGVPIKFLTKFTDWLDSEIWQDLKSIPEAKEYLSIGFTLTGRDDLEPGPSSKMARMEGLRKVHDDGFKTFTSIEPVIDPTISLSIIKDCVGFVDLFKVGLESHKHYDKAVVAQFVDDLAAIPEKPTIYLKDSIMEYLDGRTRESYGDNFVNVDSIS